MALTITLPDELAEKLQQVAAEQRLSVEEIAAIILRNTLWQEDFFLTPEWVVAKIRALPANPNAIRPAQGSLVEALQNAAHDPDFNLEEWEREWAAVEAEMQAMEDREATKQTGKPQKFGRSDFLIAEINRVCDISDTSLDPVIQRMQMLSIEPEEW